MSNIDDVSPATSTNSYDPNSRIAYDVISAVNNKTAVFPKGTWWVVRYAGASVAA